MSGSTGLKERVTNGKTIGFRWKYILLPVAILLLSVILTAVYYGRLPDQVAYHFQSDGSPDRWTGRGTVILWMLLPQLILALIAVVTTWGMTLFGNRFKLQERTVMKPETVILLMGNIITLPQLILCFAMADIFSYNAYQIHLPSVWVFALIVMAMGGVVIGFFFFRAIRQVLRTR
ncbi:DUF1648 domain-containing protein [Chloroflexota bacterium]